MKIATFNVNSVKSRLPILLPWLKEASPDVVLLQETKCTDDTFPRMEIEDLGYNLALHGQKTYNGVAILSKHPIEEVKSGLPGEDTDDHARYIEALIMAGKTTMRVASVYVPNGSEVGSDKYQFKLRFYERLARHAELLLSYREPLVIGGDYNVAPFAIDVHNPGFWEKTVLFHVTMRDALRRLLNMGLYDAMRLVRPHEQLFSWWDYRANSLENDDGVRIDHLLCSAQAADKLVDCEIVKSLRLLDKPSDHTPVMAEFAA